MGFFSRIKKLWGGEAEPQAPTQEPREAAEPQAAPEASGERATGQPDAEPQPPREAAVPQGELEEPAAEPAAAEPPAPQPADEPAPRKETGWRRLFGKTSEEPAQEEATPEQPEILFQEKPTAQAVLEPWQQALVQALGDAEPRLSIWMTHILDGVDKRGDILWGRLRFLFTQLDVPAGEGEEFIRRFDAWLQDMDYDQVEEFRSELQYRMALALELEDEEDERNRLFLKLSAGLGKTREQLTMRIDQLLSMAGGYDEEFWEELEEILLMADVGVTASQELLKRLRPKVRQASSRDAADFKALLKEELTEVFVEPREPEVPRPPEVVLMIGVNGAGKTTTIAKLAHRAQMQGRKVLVAAGDTFRAAAIEQLQVWSKRVGAGFYAKAHGSDPAAVAFEAVDYAMQEGYDLVFVDTAGRLQTKHNLMEELKKINRVLGKKLEGAPHRTILVLDATTGQNALSQVKLFSQAAPDEVVLTTLDGTAKGGIIVAIALEFKIPISFIGLGEKMEDLRPFSGQEFANALFD
jgi:fused signal recognition particle receptor